MSDGLDIQVSTRGLPPSQPGGARAAMLELLADEVKRQIRAHPSNSARVRSSIGVVIDYGQGEVEVTTTGTGFGAFVRRSDHTTRYARTDYRPTGKQRRKSVVYQTEIARDLREAIPRLASKTGNIALAALAEALGPVATRSEPAQRGRRRV